MSNKEPNETNLSEIYNELTAEKRRENIDIAKERMQKNLPYLRKIARLSINELAEQLDVTRQSINNLESGKTSITYIQCLALRLIFNLYAQDDYILRMAIDILLDDNSENYDKETVHLFKSNVQMIAVARAENADLNSSFFSEDLNKKLLIFAKRPSEATLNNTEKLKEHFTSFGVMESISKKRTLKRRSPLFATYCYSLGDSFGDFYDDSYNKLTEDSTKTATNRIESPDGSDDTDDRRYKEQYLINQSIQNTMDFVKRTSFIDKNRKKNMH